MRKLEVTCYTICITCIVAGVVFSLVTIWGDVENVLAWKGFLTIAVFFPGGILTLDVNKILEGRMSGAASDKNNP